MNNWKETDKHLPYTFYGRDMQKIYLFSFLVVVSPYVLLPPFVSLERFTIKKFACQDQNSHGNFCLA